MLANQTNGFELFKSDFYIFINDVYLRTHVHSNKLVFPLRHKNYLLNTGIICFTHNYYLRHNLYYYLNR